MADDKQVVLVKKTQPGIRKTVSAQEYEQQKEQLQHQGWTRADDQRK